MLNSETVVMIGERLSRIFNVASSGMQGNALSAFYFILTLQKAMGNLDSNEVLSTG